MILVALEPNVRGCMALILREKGKQLVALENLCVNQSIEEDFQSLGALLQKLFFAFKPLELGGEGRDSVASVLFEQLVPQPFEVSVALANVVVHVVGGGIILANVYRKQGWRSRNEALDRGLEPMRVVSLAAIVAAFIR
eukprot:CAMPEP_0197526784 /NCGR_PEP_ID=MMETSP1318-20131121/19330_1 /TAXON_ID=552666 /ORGANISM="Partenskyella glossopodia, Strain RCC365" /LENGTH=138 /DNA_ID=CAMNT_0043081115 /DNA_START=363 /DNA_END=778 /DNA_ORIENTATION=-